MPRIVSLFALMFLILPVSTAGANAPKDQAASYNRLNAEITAGYTRLCQGVPEGERRRCMRLNAFALEDFMQHGVRIDAGMGRDPVVKDLAVEGPAAAQIAMGCVQSSADQVNKTINAVAIVSCVQQAHRRAAAESERRAAEYQRSTVALCNERNGQVSSVCLDIDLRKAGRQLVTLEDGRRLRGIEMRDDPERLAEIVEACKAESMDKDRLDAQAAMTCIRAHVLEASKDRFKIPM